MKDNYNIKNYANLEKLLIETKSHLIIKNLNEVKKDDSGLKPKSPFVCIRLRTILKFLPEYILK